MDPYLVHQFSFYKKAFILLSLYVVIKFIAGLYSLPFVSSDLCQVEGELQLCYDDADVFLLTSKTATRGCQGLSATKPAIVTFEKKTITIMIHNCLIQDTVKIPESLEALDSFRNLGQGADSHGLLNLLISHPKLLISLHP